MTNVQEIWKEIPGYEGYYEISNTGKVKSLARVVIGNQGPALLKERILKQSINSCGYYMCGLCKLGKIRALTIHRLLASTFIDNPNNLLTVDHINGDRRDNRLVNLRWLSVSDNASDAHRRNRVEKSVGLYKKKKDVYKKVVVGREKRPIHQYNESGEFIKTWDTPGDAISAGFKNVYKAISKNHKCEGYFFKY